MLLVRDIMYCKPGKVRPLVEKFLKMSEFMEKKGLGSVRVLTDVAGERYWTMVAEIEVESLAAYENAFTEEAMKEMGPLMEGYHDLVDHGKREIYTIER